MEKTMRRFTLLLVVALLGGTDRVAAQETVETRGITSVIKIDEVIFGHLTELNGKFKLRATELTFAPDGYVGVHHHVGPGIRYVISGELFRKYALELVALAPDVILASGFPSIAALHPVTHSVPVVFVLVADPVGAGFVESLARPGGNVTGFALYEFGMSAKWLELLKRIAPNVTRVGVLRDAALTAGVAQLAAIQSVAPSLGIEVSSIGVREGSEIERAVTAFAGSSNRGLIMTPSPYTAPVRNLIIALAARHKLPTVYYQRYLVAAGGLASYGPDFLDEYRRAAGYVNRILKGEK